MQGDRGLPVPGPPSTTTVPASESRITASCSAWIVDTMSRIAVSGGPTVRERRGVGRRDVVRPVRDEHVVVEIHHPLVRRDPGQDEVAAPIQPHRWGERGAIERLRVGRPPVQQRSVDTGVGQPVRTT